MDSISVVITAYNAAGFIDATIQSVLAQSFPSWELVIVDDGSSDNTSEIAAGYAERDERIRTLGQSNGGIASSRNYGYENISPNSRYVLFLDHDDVLESHAFDTLLEALRNDPSAVAAYGLGRFIDARGAVTQEGELEKALRSRVAYIDGKRIPWPVDKPTTFDVVVLWSYIITPGLVLIRRDCLPEKPLFDASVAPADDWDLWFRLTLIGHIRLVDTVVLNYRRHEGNASRNEILMEAAAVRARRKFFAIESLSQDQRKSVLACYQFVEKEKYYLYRSRTRRTLLRGRLREATVNAARSISALFRSFRSRI